MGAHAHPRTRAVHPPRASRIVSCRFLQLGSPVGLDRVVLVSGITTVVIRELRAEQPRLRTTSVHLGLAIVAAYATASAIWAGTLKSSGPFFSLLDCLGIVP